MDIPCGHAENSVLFDQANHVSTDIWNEIDRGKTSFLYQWKLLPAQVLLLESWALDFLLILNLYFEMMWL